MPSQRSAHLNNTELEQQQLDSIDLLISV
jgi:hypothetical protein